MRTRIFQRERDQLMNPYCKVFTVQPSGGEKELVSSITIEGFHAADEVAVSDTVRAFESWARSVVRLTEPQAARRIEVHIHG